MKVLITGAASGIGYATALELIKKGHFVYITVETENQLKELATKKELKGKEGKSVQYFKLDITKEKDRNLIKDLDIDVLINNAAIGNGGSIIEADEDRIRENYEVNFFGTILLTKIALNKMIDKGSGRVLMVSSILSEMPMAFMGIYSSTKAALTNISIALHRELKIMNSDVKVVIIEPGIYHTGFNQVMLDNKFDNENSKFKDVREKIRSEQQLELDMMKHHELKSISTAIVRAVEDRNPELIYRAPFTHFIFSRLFMIFKK